MFLTKMVLKGFKSFANNTTINFKEGLTVIIGPNGSGKSNISDALKWVLGEASKKTLRASSSKDVIFSGASDFPPSEFAEVSLYFDNSNKILDYPNDSIVITRKCYMNKDENQYFIDNKLVRRKDIKNLFLDTGLGNTDLSIISQGSVSKITESKPDQLKDLLKEAAGVAKYQQQKKETLSKLEIVSIDLNVLEVKLKALQRQLKSLEGAKNKAESYFELRKKLTELELPIIQLQLNNSYEEEQKYQGELDKNNHKKEFIAKENLNLTKEIKELQNELLIVEKEADTLQIKYNEMQNNLNKIEKVEGNQQAIENKIKYFAKSIQELKNIVANSSAKEEEVNQKIALLKTQQFNFTVENEQNNSNLIRVEIELEKNDSKEANKNFGTQKIIENQKLFKKIYGTVGDLITYDKKYALAIKTALANKLQNIVVDNEDTIKQAIKFLKDNKLGTATFIPNAQIKNKLFPEEYLSSIKRLTGLLGKLDEFIDISKEFANIPSYLSGNILLFENINSALMGAKFINYKYMIVTLEGDIIYPGFTVKGGYSKIASFQEQREKLLRAQKLLNKKIAFDLNKLNDINNQIRTLSSERNDLQNEEIRISERLNYLELQLQQALLSYKNLTAQNFDLSQIDQFLSTEKIDQLSIEQLGNNLRSAINKRQTLTTNIITLQDRQSDFNAKWADLIERISELKFILSQNTQKIFANLEILQNDYHLSYEQLKNKKFALQLNDLDQKELEQLKLREQLADLGAIDEEAVEKYDQLFLEYNQLTNDVKELVDTKDKLLGIIARADSEMIKKMDQTFFKVNERFDSLFKMLFRGGNAKLIFSEPENILDSGIEIIASAPGKKIKNLNLYSGGEKALIALSLIFAINEVNNLPLLLLDEVEAALDESNVERFAKFAKELNETTQLIIVTHRPGTMKEADYLYGVTMQNKGITDIFKLKTEIPLFDLTLENKSQNVE